MKYSNLVNCGDLYQFYEEFIAILNKLTRILVYFDLIVIDDLCT